MNGAAASAKCGVGPGLGVGGFGRGCAVVQGARHEARQPWPYCAAQDSACNASVPTAYYTVLLLNEDHKGAAGVWQSVVVGAGPGGPGPTVVCVALPCPAYPNFDSQVCP